MARVLQVVTELVVGGASLTMLDFAEDLAAEHEIHIVHGKIVDPSNAVAVRAREHFPSYELARLGRPLAPRDDAASIGAFNALCRRIQPDIIHTRSSKAGFVGRAGAPLHGADVLFHTIHGWGHTPLDGQLRRSALITAERVCALRTTKLIAVSPEVRDEGLALHIGRRSQYTLIGDPVEMRPNGFNFDKARAAARVQLRLPPDAEVIGWVGRFSAQKDPGTLAELLSRLLMERHNVYAVLIGDGPDRAVVESRLASEIAERRVLLTGVRNDVAALYPAFDVVVHTSRWEGHPRVVREALAALVPVVTARVHGTGVIATDPRLGTRVAAGDTQAYAAAVTAILGSPTLRAPIADTALAPLRAVAREPYRLMRELYRTALANAGSEHPQRPPRVP